MNLLQTFFAQSKDCGGVDAEAETAGMHIYLS